jgi:hypothetical protein
MLRQSVWRCRSGSLWLLIRHWLVVLKLVAPTVAAIAMTLAVLFGVFVRRASDR